MRGTWRDLPRNSMTTLQFFILIGNIVLVNTVVVGTLMAMAGRQWKQFAVLFPPMPELVKAHRRTWQTVKLGWFSWGLSFQITVDAAHVHLTPGPRIGKLMGNRTASIPLAAFAQATDVAARPRSRFGRFRLKLGGQTVELPDWIAVGIAEASGPRAMPRPSSPVQ